jgi:hypothetical protein
VICSITLTSASVARTSGRAGSPTAVIATPTKIEKTTICRISLSAIASIIDSGKMCAMNLAKSNAERSTPAVASAGGSGRPSALPAGRT